MKKNKPYFPKHTIVESNDSYWLYRDGKILICPFHRISSGGDSNCGSWCALFQCYRGRFGPNKKQTQGRVILHCGDYRADFDISEGK